MDVTAPTNPMDMTSILLSIQATMAEQKEEIRELKAARERNRDDQQYEDARAGPVYVQDDQQYPTPRSTRARAQDDQQQPALRSGRAYAQEEQPRSASRASSASSSSSTSSKRFKGMSMDSIINCVPVQKAMSYMYNMPPYNTMSTAAIKTKDELMTLASAIKSLLQMLNKAGVQVPDLDDYFE